MRSNILLALSSVILIVLLLKNKFSPLAIAVFALGIAIAVYSNPNLSFKLSLNLHPPPMFIPSIQGITFSLLVVVLAQVVLTFSNTILATCLVINERFPNKKIREKSLAMNMGLMNTLLSFISGILTCHEANGFCLSILLRCKD